MSVDADGLIHVTFYDDRHYNDTSDQLDGPASDPNNASRCDVFYTHSANGGVSFQANEELYELPPPQESPPAADFNLSVPDFRIGHYMGIAAGTDRIWTSYMGSTDSDTNSNQSVIWSSQIVLDP